MLKITLPELYTVPKIVYGLLDYTLLSNGMYLMLSLLSLCAALLYTAVKVSANNVPPQSTAPGISHNMRARIPTRTNQRASKVLFH